MNTFTNAINNKLTLKETENGAVARNTTNSALYDLFALGGAYRNRSAEEQTRLFLKAFEESPIYAMKCLFYLRDCRGGQGERQFFRNCYAWVSRISPFLGERFLPFIPFYGRWDDLIYLLDVDIPQQVKHEVVSIILTQLNEDFESDEPSLLAKWMPSENASSSKTKAAARRMRKLLGITAADYRKTLSYIRKKLNLVESQMSQNRWDLIQFDKLPSVAGLRYSGAFLRNEITSERYKEFLNQEKPKVNASVLYPSNLVHKALRSSCMADDKAIDVYWDNLPDYFHGHEASLMCVCDTSGSMTWSSIGAMPIETAIALSIYAAQRNQGDFHNYFITFSTHPAFVKVDDRFGFAYAARQIYDNSINDSTNLNAVFDLLYTGVMNGTFKAKDLPKTLVVISDMEIDKATARYYGLDNEVVCWTKENSQTQMELLREKWEKAGLELPKLVYWNVEARNDTILDIGPDVSLVSGSSPVLFESICSGKTGYDLMMDKLNSERYGVIDW